MEIREFAERVLFSTSLEEKLKPVRDLTDEEPGIALGTPGEPGRPIDLRLRKDGVRLQFPGVTRLMDDEQRGILLHFFANHELLATELMTLVLLKFPEAPSSFRRGIVRTLAEEQLHTKWYLERIRDCGLKFGDFPLNRFFWDAIAPMETPLDYVTRLSLTFEQANLDFSRYYAALMREAGDERTAKILSRIHDDEITHVRYGLKWFRRWKREVESDWEAFRKQLRFPLSPARAKSTMIFDAGSRRKAGLDDDFIQELEVFSRSRGRTPNVFVFTADAEAAMAHGLDARSYAPRKIVGQLTTDLEILPAFLARRDDVVLMRQTPSLVHRARLQGLGFELPEFEQLNDRGQISRNCLLRERKIHELRPWAFCPQSAIMLSPLGELNWNEAVRSLFSKSSQAEKLRLNSKICRTAAEIDGALDDYKEEGILEVLVKLPFGASAQRNRKFAADAPKPMRSLIKRFVGAYGSVVIEPWLDRKFDFSVQYSMEDCGLRRLAFIQLENDARGQFRACQANVKFCRGVEENVRRFLMSGALTVYDGEVPLKLESFLREARYRGPVGVDAFVYCEADGVLKLRKIVEVNPRFTMGRVALELMRRVAPGRSIRFELRRSRNPEERIRKLETANPPVIDKNGRMTSGCLVLNEAPETVLAMLTVGV